MWLQQGKQNYGIGRPCCLGLAPHRINLIWINGSCTLQKSGMSRNRKDASPVFLERIRFLRI